MRANLIRWGELQNQGKSIQACSGAKLVSEIGFDVAEQNKTQSTAGPPPPAEDDKSK
jgi:hypothetical protein